MRHVRRFTLSLSMYLTFLSFLFVIVVRAVGVTAKGEVLCLVCVCILLWRWTASRKSATVYAELPTLSEYWRAQVFHSGSSHLITSCVISAAAMCSGSLIELCQVFQACWRLAIQAETLLCLKGLAMVYVSYCCNVSTAREYSR